MTVLETLAQAELFAGVPDAARRELEELGHRRSVGAGETLFRIGDDAQEFHVIRRGRVELTFPLAVMGETKETRFQSLEAGRTVAWSALVPPHRLTMSARASTDVELVSFPRGPVLEHLARRPEVGFVVMGNLSRVVAARLHEVLALWLREVQRNVSRTYR